MKKKGDLIVGFISLQYHNNFQPLMICKSNFIHSLLQNLFKLISDVKKTLIKNRFQLQTSSFSDFIFIIQSEVNSYIFSLFLKTKMSYNYQNMNDLSYSNPMYQQRNKLPQSVVRANNTPRKQTLMRNQSFQNRQYNEDLIQMIAKIRSLEDDVLNERFKNQSLQRKMDEYERIIENLQYELTSQSYQLKKYKHEIQLSNEKNLQILKYEQNLRIVGQEIQELNVVLISKNKDYELVLEKTRNLQFELKKSTEETHLVNLNHSIWMKQIDTIIDEYNYQIESDKQPGLHNDQSKLANSPAYGKVYSPSSSANFNRQSHFASKFVSSGNGRFVSSGNGKFVSNQNLNKQFSPARSHNAKFHDESMTLNFNNLNGQMTKKIESLRALFSQLTNEVNYLRKQYQQTKSQSSLSLIREKQKYIKAQYQNKLLDQRLKDQNKKHDLVSSYYNEKKVEQIIEDMLKKEDQYIVCIEQLKHQNHTLKEEVTQLQTNNSYVQKIDFQEKQSMIENLRKQNILLQATIAQLSQHVRTLENRCDSIVSLTERESHKEAQTGIQMVKKIRRVEEENYQLKIRIQELMGEISLLNKEIYILKGDQDELQHSSTRNK